MSQPSQPVPPPPPAPNAYSSPVSIIGPHFCVPYPVDLAVVEKALAFGDGNYAVTDINGNMLFKVKGKLLSLHDNRVLLDSLDNSLVTIRRKIISLHDKWHVFRGESTDFKDLLFTVGRSSLIQLKTTLNVYLASNTKEDVCDFKVKGSWKERACVIYAGESSSIVAQMHKKAWVGSFLAGKDKFMVTVYPNIDYAFIVALTVILDAINDEDAD